jgi:hypothetical protein
MARKLQREGRNRNGERQYSLHENVWNQMFGKAAGNKYKFIYVYTKKYLY